MKDFLLGVGAVLLMIMLGTISLLFSLVGWVLIAVVVWFVWGVLSGDFSPPPLPFKGQ